MMQIKDPQAPATPAQINYLTSLVAKRDDPTTCERFQFAQIVGFLAKGTASEMIDALLKAPLKAAMTPAQQYGATAQQIAQAFGVPAGVLTSDPTPVAPTLTELPKFGYYNLDGTLFYYDVTGKDQYPVLRKLVILTTYSGAKKGSWKKLFAPYGKGAKVTASWVPFAGKGYMKEPVTKTTMVHPVLVDAVLAGAKPLSETEAGKLGKQFGFCVRCGATLTDPVSVANGIGPVCAKYWA